MTGSGDIEGLEDTMADRGMTELEAIIFHGINECVQNNPESDNNDLARFLAQYIVDHLKDMP